MGGLHDVTREAGFEAKESGESRNGIGSRWGASGAVVGPAGDTPRENTAPVITLGEEEISDVSLATFYVFDNENAGAHRLGLQLAKGRGHGGCRSCAIHRGCRGAVACGGCGGGPTGSGGPDGL